MWGWFLFGFAADDGVLDIAVSPGATIHEVAPTDSGVIQLVVEGNRLPIDQELRDASARWVSDIDAVSIGGGTWFVTLQTERNDLGVRFVSSKPSRLTIVLTPGPTGSRAARDEVATLRELLDAPPQRRPEAPLPVLLTPLRGNATTLSKGPEGEAPLPLWDVVEEPRLRGWGAIDHWRIELAASSDANRQVVAWYRLGIEHLEMGLAREAVVYLDRVGASDADHDVAAVSLAAARAHARLGHADRVRELCRAAGDAGASELALLDCLGSASSIDGSPAPSDLARALLAADDTPQHRWLAARLLQTDHRNSEALPLLEGLAKERDPLVLAALGDARYASGDNVGASEAWSKVVGDPDLAPIVAVRLAMVHMADGGPTTWAAHIPSLLTASAAPDRSAADAHYLLAQIAATYHDPELAADHLNALWTRFPHLALQSDVPERLVSVCATRLAQLDRQQRLPELAAFFRSSWRPELDTMVGDTHILERTAEVHALLGLDDDALATQLRVMAVHTRLGRDDPPALLALGRMYVRTGRAREALQTLDYLATLESNLFPGAVSAAAAEAQEALGDHASALARWQEAEAAGFPDAHRRRGLLLAADGRCAEAEPVLADVDEDEARLARARCFLTLGKEDETLAVLADSLVDPLAASDAAWLTSVAAVRTGAVAPTDGIWSRLAAEEAAAAQFDDRVLERR